jgi:transposase
MSQDIARSFNVPDGLLLDRVDTHRQRIDLHVRSSRVTARCTRCGQRTYRIHQYHERRVVHDWIGTRTVILVVRVRRFQCAPCGKPFTETIPGRVPRHQRTVHATTRVLGELRGRSLAAVADALRVDDHTIAAVLRASMGSQPIPWPARGELRLGLDGHGCTRGSAPCTVTELRTRRLLRVLPNDRQETIRAFLRSIPPLVRHRITEVSTDCDHGYRAVITTELPQAHLVADRFHVIQQANELIDQVRRVVQDPKRPIPKRIWLLGKEKLRSREMEAIVAWGERYPILWDLWICKEDLRQVYEVRHRRIAAFRLRKIAERYRSLPSGYARTFAGTLERWRDPILNFFDHRTTNGYTEGLHRKFKMLQRISFGFRNIETYIAKVTLACVPLWLVLHHTQFR